MTSSGRVYVPLQGFTLAFTLWKVQPGVDSEAFSGKQVQTCGIIVGALRDHELCVVRTVIGIPFDKMKKPDGRYNSKPTAYKISKTDELVYARYCNLKHDMAKQFDRMPAILELL